MTQLIHRRKFLTGGVAFLAAPAIIRVAQLMPIKVQEEFTPQIWKFASQPLFIHGDMASLLLNRMDLKLWPGAVNWIPLEQGPRSGDIA